MLRKIIHIFFILYMLFVTTGYTITKHYCQSELQSVSLFTEVERCCDGIDGCCHDETSFHKIGNDFLQTNFENSKISTIILYDIEPSQYDDIKCISSVFINNTIKSPPPKATNKRLALIQSYLI